MYGTHMNDHDYPSNENSHWGLSTALAHEMPLEEFENEEYDDGYDLTIKNLFVLLIVGMAVILLVFGLLS